MSRARLPRRDMRRPQRGRRRIRGVGDDLGRALDEVNARGLLEEQQAALHRDITCFGPDVFRGFLPRAWVGVALWYKQKGYYFYGRIQLLGIWALRDGEEIALVSGLRALHYALPFFNAESYYHRIQREFRTCYMDNGQPPPQAAWRYRTNWEPARRLEIRHELEELLLQWAAQPD